MNETAYPIPKVTEDIGSAVQQEFSSGIENPLAVIKRNIFS